MRMLMLLPAAVLALAGPGAAQELVRTAFSGGAPEASGGGLVLRGSVGEAGVTGETVSGGGLEMTPGFWIPLLIWTATDAPIVPESPASAVRFVTSLGLSSPNPFRNGTRIEFSLAEAARVRISVFDVAGRRVATVVEGRLPAGRHHAAWDGRDHRGRSVATGVYFYRLDVEGGWSDTQRTLRLR